MAELIQELSEEERAHAREVSMPDWQNPMLAKLTHDHFSDDQWFYERKLDGQRVLAYMDTHGGVRLMSRNKKRLNDTYPDIEQALQDIAPRGCVIDGEIVAFDQNGVSDFQRLQPRMQASSREESKQSKVKVHYYVFDCLYVDGHDITRCPLRARKKLLRKAIDWGEPVHWTQHRSSDGIEYYKEACEKGWEGLIAKHAESPYVHGRSPKWLKFKCVRRQELVIGGFTDPKGSRKGFGALLLGFYRDGDFIYAGQVGTGFDDETLDDLRERLDRLERKTSPYDQGEPETKGVHFVSPKLVCEVGFTEWTKDGKLRHPRYKGLRDDKKPTDVHKETIAQRADL